MDDAKNENKLPRSGFAIAALVLSINALEQSLIPLFFKLSIISAFAALISAVIAMIMIYMRKSSGMGMVIAALVMCFVAGIILLCTQIYFTEAASTLLSQFMQG